MEAIRRNNQLSSWALVRAIKAELQGERSRWASKAGSAVKSLITYDPPLVCEAWIWMQVWYKEAVNRPPLPARVYLATITAEREDLYRHVPSPGDPIPVEDPPFSLSVDDSIPDDEEISLAVRRLCLNC